MKYSTQELADKTESELVGNPSLIVEHIAFDTRNLFTTHNVAFIALNSARNSGEKYIADAISKGIKIIISENKNIENKDVTWIITPDTTRFIQRLAKRHLENLPNLKTIGITGSNGKTIVKEWLFQCLGADISTVKSPKSFNSQIGLPLSVLQADEHHRLGIFEAGISQPGEMDMLAEILKPSIGVFTYIGTAHLSHFKNQEELINEKIKLFKDSETIFFNGDNPLVYKYLNQLYSSKNLISFGLGEHNRFYVKKYWNSARHVSFYMDGDVLDLDVEQQDDATLTNAIGVVAVLQNFGFSKEAITEKINSLKAVEMRLESVEGQNHNLIINDSYNLDPDSLKIAFQFIKEYRKDKKILVLTDFTDVQAPEQFYPEIVRLVNEQQFSKVFLIGTDITAYQNRFSAETFTFRDAAQLIDSQIFKTIENALVLIKGARKFETDQLKNILQLQKHDTVLEVHLNALLHNINVHKKFLKPETKIMAMVKAFAYGTGGFEVAEFLQHHHIDYLGVAYADEGAELRKKGITVPIMVMNPEQHSYDAVIDYRLEPEIYSFRVLELFCNRLKEKGIQEDYPIHLKLETGMHRLGFKASELSQLVQILKTKKVKVTSIFSHLSTADMPEERAYAEQQLNCFDAMSTALIEGLGYAPIRHILNSPGITAFPGYQFDMVRIGIGMYGISYDSDMKRQLQNVVKFKTLISQVSEIDSGTSVGYGRAFQATQTARIATLPVGYADGIHRIAGNGVGKVGIHNTLAPIVGRICMDMMMVDVSGIDAKEGDEVVIFNGNPSVEEFASYCQTIPYEILTSISRRVKRVYIKN